jgi:branched-chain amino acid transport system ATP-binding protein
LLETKGLTKYFGGLCAVNRLNLSIKAEEIVGLIGPNGAGKTTVFNLITGFHQASSGEILFNGEKLVGQKPHGIAEIGIVRTFQIAKLFPDFTVLQNLRAASHLFMRVNLWEAIFRTSSYRKKEANGLDHAMKILRFLRLDSWKNEFARILPHGHQKLLGIGMALAATPKLLLLDEPLGGMNSEEIDRALEIIREVRAQGVAILLIEHNMRAVMRICDRIVVLSFGEEIAKGSPEEIRQNKAVIEAYLGAGEDES